MTNDEIHRAVIVATDDRVRATQIMQPSIKQGYDRETNSYPRTPAPYIKICLSGTYTPGSRSHPVTLREINLIVQQLGLNPAEVTFYSNTIHVPLSIREPELPF